MDSNLRSLNSHTEAINAIRFTHDGNYCMTASSDRSVKLWNPSKDSLHQTNEHQRSALLIKTYDGSHGYSILDVSIFHDNSRFVSAGFDKALFLMDVATGKTIRRIQAHNHKINTIDLNFDDTIVVSGSYDQTVAIWDLRSNNREPIQTFRDFKDSVSCLVISESSIIVGSIDSTVRIYDLRSGFCHVDDMIDPVINIKLSSDKKSVLAMCLGDKVKLLDISTGKILNEYSTHGHIHNNYKSEIAFAVDDQHILVPSEDCSLCHYNILTKSLIRKTKHIHKMPISSISYHPKDRCFLTASYDGTATFWISDKYN